MEDTDWRPSACPGCGWQRAAARYPVCVNIRCKEYGRGGPDKVERTMITTNEQIKYVWVRSNGSIGLIDDPVKVYHYDEFDKEGDKIYQLGSEVEVRVTVAVKNKTVYRSGLKDDLGVGDYRG